MIYPFSSYQVEHEVELTYWPETGNTVLGVYSKTDKDGRLFDDAYIDGYYRAWYYYWIIVNKHNRMFKKDPKRKH